MRTSELTTCLGRLKIVFCLCIVLFPGGEGVHLPATENKREWLARPVVWKKSVESVGKYDV